MGLANLVSFREDVDMALKMFEESKENGTLITSSTCMLLLNIMAKTGNKDFERGKVTCYTPDVEH